MRCENSAGVAAENQARLLGSLDAVELDAARHADLAETRLAAVAREKTKTDRLEVQLFKMDMAYERLAFQHKALLQENATLKRRDDAMHEDLQLATSDAERYKALCEEQTSTISKMEDRISKPERVKMNARIRSEMKRREMDGTQPYFKNM